MFELRPYGLIYNGDPTLTVSLEFDVTRLANPKSAILADLSFINILAGFMSLCKNPASPKNKNPSRISLMIGVAYNSDNLVLFLIKVSKSPSLQNSVII
jgi:hypothetical protein